LTTDTICLQLGLTFFFSKPNPVCPADLEPLFEDKVRKWSQNQRGHTHSVTY